MIGGDIKNMQTRINYDDYMGSKKNTTQVNSYGDLEQENKAHKKKNTSKEPKNGETN